MLFSISLSWLFEPNILFPLPAAAVYGPMKYLGKDGGRIAVAGVKVKNTVITDFLDSRDGSQYINFCQWLLHFSLYDNVRAREYAEAFHWATVGLFESNCNGSYLEVFYILSSCIVL